MYDVGAHIGFYTLPAVRMGTRAIAFAPDPESVMRLGAHVDHNSLGNKGRIGEVAGWSSSSPSITFRGGLPRSKGGVSWQDRQPVLATGEVIEVAAICLDDFVGTGGPAPHVIKVDVEGSGSEVLNGAANTLRNHRPVLIAEGHTADEYAAVSYILEDAAYTARWDTLPRASCDSVLRFYHPFLIELIRAFGRGALLGRSERGGDFVNAEQLNLTPKFVAVATAGQCAKPTSRLAERHSPQHSLQIFHILLTCP